MRSRGDASPSRRALEATLQHKLANILLETNEQFLSAPLLLHRSTTPVFPEGEEPGVWRLCGNGTHDFTTFFNAISIQKWHDYTVVGDVRLHLEVRGGAFELVQTRADLFSWDAVVVEETRAAYSASEEWATIDVPMRSDDADVIEGFVVAISGDDPVFLRDSYYYAEVDEADVRPVELALCTTTFRKESYIEHNIGLVKNDILTDDGPIATHFTQHVVDNGRTLDVAKHESDRVHIHPNDNVGGSGGYARGMIEAMEQEPKATHVLLMDDDVVISPESIKRTFNMLALRNAEHEDWFVSGAMMDLFEPDRRFEDTGYVTYVGDCIPLKAGKSMNQLHNVVGNELPVITTDEKTLDRETQAYAGWWYCVIPMSAIEKNGLPLPVFVRYDDIEYGIRCQAKFMTMNGICLWHPSFPRRYNAAVERYQVTRNEFVGQMTTGMAPLANFELKLYHAVQLELKKFNYTNARLALDGFEDFLKGPGFIMAPGNVEKAFMQANRNAEKLVPFDELRRQAAEEGIDLSGISLVDIQQDADKVRDDSRSMPQRIQDFATFNGQRVDMGYVKKGTVGFIDVAGWIYPAGEIRRKDTIVAVDLENQRGVIRHMDRAQFKEVWDRYNRDIKYYRSHKEQLEKEYSAQRDKITSVEWWKEYLGM